MQAPPNAVGTITHEGVTSSSNTASADEMRSALGIEAPPEVESTEPTVTDEAPPADAEAQPPAASEPVTDASKSAEAKRKPAQPRIDKLTFEREEAKREAAKERAAREASERKIEELRQEWRREFEELRRSATPKQEQPKADPNADPEPDYTNTEQYPDGQFDRKYLKDQARWEARQEFREQQKAAQERYQAEMAERQQFERAQAERQRLQTFGQKITTALSTQPADVREKMESVAMSRPMWDAVLDSEHPDQVLAYMADHPEDAQRLAALPPLQALRAMNRIEYELEQAASLTGSAPAKPKTSAHPPVSPVSGSHAAPSASGPPGPDASYEEHKAYYDQVEREEWKAGRR